VGAGTSGPSMSPLKTTSQPFNAHGGGGGMYGGFSSFGGRSMFSGYNNHAGGAPPGTTGGSSLIGGVHPMGTGSSAAPASRSGSSNIGSSMSWGNHQWLLWFVLSFLVRRRPCRLYGRFSSCRYYTPSRNVVASFSSLSLSTAHLLFGLQTGTLTLRERARAKERYFGRDATKSSVFCCFVEMSSLVFDGWGTLFRVLAKEAAVGVDARPSLPPSTYPAAGVGEEGKGVLSLPTLASWLLFLSWR